MMPEREQVARQLYTMFSDWGRAGAPWEKLSAPSKRRWLRHADTLIEWWRAFTPR